MKCYIKIQDGTPIGYPIVESNFKQVFPEIDTNNLPPQWANFDNSPPLQRQLGPYEVFEGENYVMQNGIVTREAVVRPMTDQEKQDLQKRVIDDWAENGFASWSFDETTCTFTPPVPCPEDGNFYRWNESTLTWDEVK